MPFLAVDVGDGRDGDVLDAARLTDPDVGERAELLSHPLLEDGITEIDRAVVLLLVLEHEHPDRSDASNDPVGTRDYARSRAKRR